MAPEPEVQPWPITNQYQHFLMFSILFIIGLILNLIKSSHHSFCSSIFVNICIPRSLTSVLGSFWLPLSENDLGVGVANDINSFQIYNDHDYNL